MDDEAVSPVIGTIILVAVAMVMTLVIWVMFSPLTDEGVPETRFVSFDIDSTGPGGTLTVVHAGEQVLHWNQISITPTSTASCTMPGGGQVSAGDVVECTTEGTLQLVHQNPDDSIIIFDGRIR